VFVFAEVEDLGDRRNRVGRDLDQVKPGLLGHGKGFLDIGGTVIVAGLVDQLHLTDADILVDARAILGRRHRTSHRTTNDTTPMLLRWAKCREKPASSQRQYVINTA